MSDKPKAIRMADELDGLCSQYDSEIAAELRRLHSELERKSDAIQRLWKERDELRTLNAELMEALRNIVQSLSDQDDEGLIEHAEPMVKARAALAKVGASK